MGIGGRSLATISLGMRGPLGVVPGVLGAELLPVARLTVELLVRRIVLLMRELTIRPEVSRGALINYRQTMKGKIVEHTCFFKI